MKTLMIILAVMAFDFGIAYIIRYNSKRQSKRDDDLFIFKLEHILQDKSFTQKERIYKAKELCRNTKGNLSAGAYFALDNINDNKS